MSRTRAPIIEPSFPSEARRGHGLAHAGVRALERHPGRAAGGGYENNFYDEEKVARERRLYEAVAERFLLEDADFRAWRWLETLWAGGDGSTGFNAHVVEFVPSAQAEPALGILSFYVTRNERFWFAVPLAELPDAMTRRGPSRSTPSRTRSTRCCGLPLPPMSSGMFG